MELTAKDLTCERGGRIVFRDVSLALQPGQLMQLTGPNGSGKSSLLRLIAGLNEAQAGHHRARRAATPTSPSASRRITSPTRRR